MCRITESGDRCLVGWGRWAACDSTVRRLGYPGRSAEQMANYVPGSGEGEDKVSETVDRFVVGLLEPRKKLIACWFYVERLSVSVIVERLKAFAKEQNVDLGRASVDVVKRDLDVIRAGVGGVMLWSM